LSSSLESFKLNLSNRLKSLKGKILNLAYLAIKLNYKEDHSIQFYVQLVLLVHMYTSSSVDVNVKCMFEEIIN